jgi:DNA-binding response OmpR family regulator
MQILVADDDPVQRKVTVRWLEQWGHAPRVEATGEAAWHALQDISGPCVAILDWMMPGMDGPEVCKRVRGATDMDPRYLLLVTAKNAQDDVVRGLEAGADDYVQKPFHPAELRARMETGIRLMDLQQRLAERVAELEAALADNRRLRRLIPICAYCKRIRSDEDYWTQLEKYLGRNLDLRFSHGICPSCYDDVFERELGELGAESDGPSGSSPDE